MTHAGLRPSILVLTSTFPRWEDDTEPAFVFELCRRLAAGAFDVHVLAPHAPGAAFEETLHGIAVTRFRYCFTRWESLAYQGGILNKLKHRPLRYGLVPLFLVAQLWAVIKLLKRKRFDCIHAHWLIPQGLIAELARRILSAVPPLVLTSHGSDIYGLQGALLERLKRWIAGRAAAVTVVSRVMQADVTDWKIDPARVSVIPMGVDLQNRFVPPAKRPNAHRLLYVGRLIEQKGLPILLQALARIARRYPDIFLKIVGDGADKTRLQKRAKMLGLEDRVEFTGAVANQDLPQVYGDADILVFPSLLREGFGLVIVEALGCECAVVVSDLPSVRDMVRPLETALMVPPRDVIQLTAAIERLLTDAPLRRALGRCGRQLVLQRFDWEIIVRRYTDLIVSVCNQQI